VVFFPLNFLLFFGGVLKFSTTKEYLSSVCSVRFILVLFGSVRSGMVRFSTIWFSANRFNPFRFISI